MAARPGPAAADGFRNPGPEERVRWQNRTDADTAKEPWLRFGPAEVVPPVEPLRTATDDWPFLYLRRPMIPDISLRGAALMGGIALLLLLWFAPRRQAQSARPTLGACLL